MVVKFFSHLWYLSSLCCYITCNVFSIEYGVSGANIAKKLVYVQLIHPSIIPTESSSNYRFLYLIFSSPKSEKKDRHVLLAEQKSYHWISVLPLDLSLTTGSQSYHWISVLPLDLSLTTGSQPYHWISVLPLDLSLTTGSQSYHWISVLPLDLSLTTGSQSYHWISVLPPSIGLRANINGCRNRKPW